MPALALFWLHVAHSACLAAMADAIGRYHANVYTRPFDALRAIESATDLRLEARFRRALHLDDDVGGAIEALRRIHGVVEARFPEPAWQPNMRSATRYEYRYSLSAEELEWRIAVAEEMVAHNEKAAALYYVRFWAYSLACIPMVYEYALAGQNIAFLRPPRAFRPLLATSCLEIIVDLEAVFGGAKPLTRTDVEASLLALHEFREVALQLLRSRSIEVEDTPPWIPHQPAQTAP